MEHTVIPFQSDHFMLYRLGDGVFAAIALDGGAAISNAGVIDLGGRTIIYDTFMTPQAACDLRLAAQQLTGRDPELIINSHYHNDHIWGNQAFSPRSWILASTQTLKLMQTAGLEELKWANDVSGRRLEEATREYETAPDRHTRRDALMWIGYFQGLVDALPSLTVRLPDVTFDGRLVIHGSSRSAELIPFESSHTGHDAILFLSDLGLVFTSDLLFVNCHPYLEECDVFLLRDTLKELSGMDATVFVPGHGPLGTAQDLASNMDYIAMCLDTAQDLVAQGDTSPQRIARATPPGQFADWGLSRFFVTNLASLCSKITANQAGTYGT